MKVRRKETLQRWRKNTGQVSSPGGDAGRSLGQVPGWEGPRLTIFLKFLKYIIVNFCSTYLIQFYCENKS